MTPTLLYEVNFMTYSEPHPERLGTAEKAVGRIRIWAKTGEEAINTAKHIAAVKGSEWVHLVSVDAISGIILEQILNDPLNGYDFMVKIQKAEMGPRSLVEV